MRRMSIVANVRPIVLVMSGALLTLTGIEPAVAESPKRGGTLSFAVVAEPPNYDCHANTSFAFVHPVAPNY